MTPDEKNPPGVSVIDMSRRYNMTLDNILIQPAFVIYKLLTQKRYLSYLSTERRYREAKYTYASQI